jgi:hypothetical protein
VSALPLAALAVTAALLFAFILLSIRPRRVQFISLLERPG